MTRSVVILMMSLIAAGTTQSAPTGINLLAQQHRVWGSAGSETELLPGGTEATYDETSSDPLDVSVTGTYIDPILGAVPLTARSRTGDFQVQTDAVFFFSQAHARSIYRFAPDAGLQTFTLQARGEGFGVGLSNESNVRLTLSDETANIQLEDFTAPTVWVDETTWSFAWERTYPVDATHIYDLMLFAFAGGGDGERGAFLAVDLRPTVIPAPGALFLGVFGAVLVRGLRRRPC